MTLRCCVCYDGAIESKGATATSRAERGNKMVYTIKKSKYEAWGYEITAKGFHNIAPSVESAINYLKDRYGADVKYRIA